MAWTVRPARVDDALDIARIHVESWQQAYRGQVPAAHLTGMSVPKRASYWAGVLGTGEATCEVVEGVDGPVGFVSLGHSRDHLAPVNTGEIYAIYVHPGTWGLGAGHALHDHARTVLADAKFRAAMLWVLSSNTQARHFYERQGWSSDPDTQTIELGGATLDKTRYRTKL